MRTSWSSTSRTWNTVPRHGGATAPHRSRTRSAQPPAAGAGHADCDLAGRPGARTHTSRAACPTCVLDDVQPGSTRVSRPSCSAASTSGPTGRFRRGPRTPAATSRRRDRARARDLGVRDPVWPRQHRDWPRCAPVDRPGGSLQASSAAADRSGRISCSATMAERPGRCCSITARARSSVKRSAIRRLSWYIVDVMPASPQHIRYVGRMRLADAGHQRRRVLRAGLKGESSDGQAVWEVIERSVARAGRMAEEQFE